MISFDLSKEFNFCPETGKLFRKGKKNPVGTLSARGYLCCGFKGKTLYVHRIIWSLHTGKDLTPQLQIDHINHNRLDNRICNLRETDNTGNSMNKTMRTANTSGATGVCWHKAAGKWRAFIKVGYKQIHLGLHADFEAAVMARKRAERQYGFHENHE